ncbi:hypothetical protein CspeluHIS016_0405250 [Cutaneotrichosporon spelunceum]|uniref:Velvet domain-containing protein n=1 Tax=Cutaneotrichosporon spelunceum TaxID=1672016 RepID=A0AAD3TW63_9TREE|nr:hypothetical protein CspeluHIS016_0405250 [Cutaneotrichosporon spelunceum]
MDPRSPADRTSPAKDKRGSASSSAGSSPADTVDKGKQRGKSSESASADNKWVESVDYAYEYVPVTQKREGRKNIQYELIMRQEPQQARMCGVGEKSDRRPVDPTPIIQLKVKTDKGEEITPMGNDGKGRSNGQLYMQNPYYFLFACLVGGDDQDSELHVIDDGRTRFLTGTPVSSLYHLKDIDNKDAAFFVFPDLGVRKEGRYKLKLTLFEIVDQEVYYCTTVHTQTFSVYSAKKFPGMQKATELSRVFAEQGLKIRVRKDPRPARNKPAGKRPKSPGMSDDEDPYNQKRHRPGSQQTYLGLEGGPRYPHDPPYASYPPPPNNGYYAQYGHGGGGPMPPPPPPSFDGYRPGSSGGPPPHHMPPGAPPPPPGTYPGPSYSYPPNYGPGYQRQAGRHSLPPNYPPDPAYGNYPPAPPPPPNAAPYDPRWADRDPRDGAPRHRDPREEMRDPREMSVPRDPREMSVPRDPREMSVPRDPRELSVPPREAPPHNPRELAPREIPPRDHRELPPRDYRDPREVYPHEMRDPRVADPRYDRRVDPRVDPRAERRVDPRADPRLDPRVDPRADPRFDPRADPRADPRLDPGPDPRLGPRMDPRALDPRDPYYRAPEYDHPPRSAGSILPPVHQPPVDRHRPTTAPAPREHQYPHPHPHRPPPPQRLPSMSSRLVAPPSLGTYHRDPRDARDREEGSRPGSGWSQDSRRSHSYRSNERPGSPDAKPTGRMGLGHLVD